MDNGEYIALLDHDDELREHALYHVATALNDHPEANIFYSDEDKIDEQGRRFDPHFKPDWNPELFYAQNYLSHLSGYKRALVEQVGGFREGFEGSQDYDLALRCVASCGGQGIHHIPFLLYHWRAVPGSTALHSGEKSYATEAGVAALKDHFSRIDPAVEVEAGDIPTTYRIRYPLPNPPPLVSLIIPTRDNHEILHTAVDSILTKTKYQNYEILVVDNQSNDPQTLAYLEKLEHDGKARVLRFNHPFNFSAINNFAVAQAAGELVALVNDDTEVISPEWLSEMVAQAVRPEVGAVGAKLLYPDGKIQHGGVVLGINGLAGHSY